MFGSINRLFINWYPAPLGHEVMGNQIAYYHLHIMEKALTKIIEGTEAFDFEADAAIQPLPAATQCRADVCTFLGDAKPKCAYAYLPRAEDAMDVMDLVPQQTPNNVLCDASVTWCDGEGCHELVPWQIPQNALCDAFVTW